MPLQAIFERACLAALVVGWLIVLRSASADSAVRAFTVTDMVQMTRIVEPEHDASRIEISPRKSKFAVVTRVGNLQTGLNEYSLRVFSLLSESYRSYEKPGSSRTRTQNGFVVAQFATSAANPRAIIDEVTTASSERDGISGLHWLSNDQEIAFVGRGADGKGSVYVVSSTGGDLKRVTDDAFDVGAFAISPNGQYIIFSAYAPPDWGDRNIHGYALGAKFASSLDRANPASDVEQNIKFYLTNLIEKSTTELDLGPSFWDRLGEISISPDSKRALIALPVKRIPTRWRGYKLFDRFPALQDIGQGYSNFPDAFSASNFFIDQYMVVDLPSARTNALVDAPTLWPRHSSIKPTWSLDSSYVLISDTYPPIAESRASISKLNTASPENAPSLIIVNVGSGSYVVVDRHRSETPCTGNGLSVRDAYWEPGSTLVLRLETATGTERSLIATERYTLNGNDRLLIAGRSNCSVAKAAKSRAESVYVSQSLNVAPEIAISLGPREGVLTDLNPIFRKLNFGKGKVFEWTDKKDRRFVGALIFPLDYRPDKRYPVVLQTGGYDGQTFIMEGGLDGLSPHPGRALAAAGIAILQLPFEVNAPGFKKDSALQPRQFIDESFEEFGENPQYQAMIEGAIDKLNAEGIAAPDNIGLLGFSRLGMRVHYFLAFSDHRVKAATVADSIQLTPYCYAAMYGRPYSHGMDNFDTTTNMFTTIGASIWRGDVNKWLERSDLFHLDQITSAVRYESYGTYMTPCMLEPYAILKRHERPVEMLHFPLASHVIKSPSTVYASKQGNVDWFAFWLKGEVDADPSKVSQYLRWKKLVASKEFNRDLTNAATN